MTHLSKKQDSFPPFYRTNLHKRHNTMKRIYPKTGNECPAQAVNNHNTLLAALRGCADALREAGKDFAAASPLAARPNLYELHEARARTAIAKARPD